MRVQSIFEEEMRMANICNYEIHVKGRKKAALFLFTAMPAYGDKEITHEEGTDEEYILWMKGDCKWYLDSSTEEKPGITIDLDSLTEDDLSSEKIYLDYWSLPLRQKSELLGVEILAHSWSINEEWESFEHYQNGKLIDSKTIRPSIPEAISDLEESPKWVLSDYPTYEAFCASIQETLGISFQEIPESYWEEDEEEEGIRVLTEDDWEDYQWDYVKLLCQSGLASLFTF